MAMTRESLTKQLTIAAEDLASMSGPVVWDVMAPIDGPAVVVMGDRRPNGMGHILPIITLNCGWQSGGIVFECLDNPIVQAVQVYRSRDTAIDVQSCRQAYFHSFQVTEAIGTTDAPAVWIRSVSDTRGDATNACRFEFVSVHACAQSRYMAIDGGGDSKGLGSCRNNAFGSVFLHVPWARQVRDLPTQMQPQFAARSRSMLSCSWVEDTSIANLTITSEPEIACATVTAVRTQRCRFAGRTLAAAGSRSNVDVSKNGWFVTELIRSKGPVSP
jgi:hypothetical protein